MFGLWDDVESIDLCGELASAGGGSRDGRLRLHHVGLRRSACLFGETDARPIGPTDLDDGSPCPMSNASSDAREKRDHKGEQNQPEGNLDREYATDASQSERNDEQQNPAAETPPRRVIARGQGTGDAVYNGDDHGHRHHDGN